MNHPTKNIPPAYSQVFEYTPGKREWGHVGKSTWWRMCRGDRNQVHDFRQRKVSFVVFIYYPSVSIVKRLDRVQGKKKFLKPKKLRKLKLIILST